MSPALLAAAPKTWPVHRVRHRRRGGTPVHVAVTYTNGARTRFPAAGGGG